MPWLRFLAAFSWKIVKNELKRSLPITRCSDTLCRSLTHVEQNAVWYTAGFVIWKLLERKSLEYEKRECLHGLVKDMCSDEDSSEQWLRTTNRGGFVPNNWLSFWAIHWTGNIYIFLFDTQWLAEHGGITQIYMWKSTYDLFSLSMTLLWLLVQYLSEIDVSTETIKIPYQEDSLLQTN